MTPGWNALTFTPDQTALAAFGSAWSWRLPEHFQPILFSIFGDVFIAAEDGSVHWLNTGTGDLSRVANTVSDFRSILGTTAINEWFLPNLVLQLHEAGRAPEPGECFTYAIFPVFAEGKYEAWNFKPVPAAQHFEYSACVIRQVADVPDGAKVRLAIEK
jgi:hypothetical protein